MNRPVAEPTGRPTPRSLVDLRIVTYNIHRCRGLDRRVRPERIAEVLAAVDADVIALQEVIGPGLTGPGQAEIIGATLGMGWVMAPARAQHQQEFDRFRPVVVFFEATAT